MPQDIFDQAAQPQQSQTTSGSGDIFDQAAQPQQSQTTSGSGDIFDQAATPPAPVLAAPPQPTQPQPAPTAQPKSSPGILDSIKSLGFDGTMNIVNNVVGSMPDAQMGLSAFHGLVGAGKNIVTGLGDVFGPTDADLHTSYFDVERRISAPMTPEESAAATHKALRGAAKLIEGGGTVALVIKAPQLMELGGLAAGFGTAAETTAARIALAKLVAGAAAGAGASKGAGKIADAAHLAPETKQLVQAVAFFTPSLLGVGLGKAGFKADIASDAESNIFAGARTPGGGFRVGAKVTPEGFKAGAQVGDTKFHVNVPLGPVPKPSAAQVTSAVMLEANLQTMRDSMAADQAAQDIVAGKAPAQAVADQQPKAPDDTPDEMRTGVLSPEMARAVAQVIKAAPKETQPTLMMQAAGKLSGWIQKVKQFIGPDGKLAMAHTPQAADKLAQTIINAEVDKHDAAADEAQKQSEEAAKPQTPAKGQSKLQQAQAERQYQRATTMIEASNSPDEAMKAMQRAGMQPDQIQQHLTRFQQEQAAATTPTIGSKAESVVEESKATIDAQIEALKAGTKKVVMLPEGSKYRPPAPAGMKRIDVTGDVPGAGTYIYNARLIKASTIRDAARAGTHGDLLGHVQTKEDIAAAPQTVAVVASKPDGTEIQTSEVDATKPELIQNQAATLAEQHPGAKIEVKPIDDVIGQRLAAQKGEGGDIFDEASAHPADEFASKPTTKGERGQSPEQESGATPGGDSAPQIKGHDGKETTLHVDDEKHPVRYRLVEADDVQPSHNPITFEENPKHSGNTRDYNKKDAKRRVMNQAQNIEPNYLVTNNPDAVNGPPIIDPSGTAYGGNSRAMTIQRAYQLHPDSAKKYRAALKEQASAFGFTPEQVDGMKNPMLVREMDAIADEKKRGAMIDALNNVPTAAHTPGETAVKNGRKLSSEDMDEISRLIDATGDGASIRDMLREHGLNAIQLFEKRGIITEEQRPQYVENNLPSEAGKDLIEDAILGKVVDDPKLMDTTPKSILNKLDSSLAAIAHIDSQNDDWNLIPVIRDALDQHAEISKRKTNVQAFQQQTGVFDQRTINPVVDAIARKLVEKPNDVKKALRGYAADAKDGRLGQGSLMGPPPTTANTFNHWFGTTLSKEEYTDAVAGSVHDEAASGETAAPREDDRSLSEGESGSAEPEASRKGGSHRAVSGPGDLAKGDRVDFNSLAGTPHTGEIAHVGERVIRIKGDDGKRYDVPNKNVLRTAKPFTAEEVDPGVSGETPILRAQSEGRIFGSDHLGYYVEPAQGNDAPVLRVDDSIVRIIDAVTARPGQESGFMDEGTDGVSLFKGQRDYLVARLRMSKSPIAKGLIRGVGLATSKHGGLIILKHGADAAKGEEQFHGLQAAHEEHILSIVAEMKNSPLISRVRSYIEEEFDYKNPSVTLALLEATAKVANDQWEDAGLTKTEGAEILSEFMLALADRAGAEVFDSIPTIGPVGRSIIEAARGVYGRRKGFDEGRDSQDVATTQVRDAAGDSRRLSGTGRIAGESSSDAEGDGGASRSGQGLSGERAATGRSAVTNTPAFKKWFGESKVVDDAGKPLVVYHGTAADFDTFTKETLGENTGASSAKAGFFFSEDPDVTAEYHGEELDPKSLSFQPSEGARVMPAYLSIRKPLTITAQEWLGSDGEEKPNFLARLADKAKDIGHDGLFIRGDKKFADEHNIKEAEADTWVAFEPNQIKSATGNSGEFNPAFNSILRNLKPIDKLAPAASVKALIADEAERVAVSRDLHNRLYDLASQDKAALLRTVQMLKQMPGTAKDQEAIYHHMENPKLPITDLQREILDTYLRPLIHQSEDDFEVVTDGSVPVDNYVHRQVKDKGGMIDKIMERVQEGRTSGGVSGGRLSTSAPAKKTRTMMALEDATARAPGFQARPPARRVVSIKGGRVTAHNSPTNTEDLGQLRTGLGTKLDGLSEKLDPIAEKLVDNAAAVKAVLKDDRAARLATFDKKIADREAAIFGDGERARAKGLDATPNNELRDQIKRLQAERDTVARTTDDAWKYSLTAATKLRKLNETRTVLENQRDRLLEQVPTEALADRVWTDKNGKQWKITQATTKEIEAKTDLRYYHNAAGSVAVNYLTLDKARRAYDFLNELKASPEFQQYAHSLESPGAIPKGWRTTQLPQFRGYFFEPHVAEVLDSYAKQAYADPPGLIEKVSNFLRASIFFNPLIHVPNLLNHWVVEKGMTHYLNPMNYPRVTKAGLRAINAVIHQNADFLEALDHGAPLQSQQFEIKQFADLFFKKMQDELGDPESSKAVELAKALGMSPVRLVKAIYDVSGKVTWYTNDIAFLQSTYEKMDRGMSLKDALTETAKHIPDYRKMTRIFDSKALGTLMANPTVTMFGAYHYGALKSYGQVMKSIGGFNWQDAGTTNDKGEPTNRAGRTKAEEKLHGLDVLAMIGIVTFMLYPLIDHLLREVTGNKKAQMRRAGASTFIYNLVMLAKGEKTPEELAESVATPAVPLKLAVELGLNRDIRTGQRVYNAKAPAATIAQQVGRRVAGAIAPVDQGLRIAEDRTDWKKTLYSMVGVSFPIHGAEKIAYQINAERLASLPPSDEATMLHYIHKSRALHDAWDGDRTKLNELMESKELTRKERIALHKDSLEPPLVYEVRNMAYADALKVYHTATPEEKAQLQPILRKKLANIIKTGKPKPPGLEE